MQFPRVSPGEDVVPLITSPEWLNGLTQLLEPAGLESAGASLRDFTRMPYVCRIKNNSGAEVVRYGLLGVDGPLYTKTDDENQFLGATLQFKGVKPKAEHAGRLAICLAPIPAGKIGLAIIANAVQVKVNISSAEHRYASIIEDDAGKLESGESGTYPMVPAETGTGVKWAIIFLSGGGGAVAASAKTYLAKVIGPVEGIPAAQLGVALAVGAPPKSKIKMFKGTVVRFTVEDIEDPDFGEDDDLAEPEREDATSVTWLLESIEGAARFSDTIARDDAGEAAPEQLEVLNWVTSMINVDDRVVILETTTVKGRLRRLIVARDCGG